MFVQNQPWAIAGRVFHSRLVLGTGKFSSPEAMRDALVAGGAEMVTVALRRADLSGKQDPFGNILEYTDSERFLPVPNTSGARNVQRAVTPGAQRTDMGHAATGRSKSCASTCS